MNLDELGKQTGFEEGKGTWSMAGLLWLKDQGFEVIHITPFDYQIFEERGGEYLLELYGKEVGEWSIAHSNMQLEQQRAKKMAKAEISKKAIPTVEDVKKYLDDSYLVKVLLNARKLDSKKGFAGHAVVVKGYNDTHFTIHDPGLPPRPNRKVTFKEFEEAWADPNQEAKELDAIKLKT
jgi:hypothetical protein